MKSDKQSGSNTEETYSAEDLIGLGTGLLVKIGLERDRARTVSEILVEGDLLGHTTHGLALLPGYLSDLESGNMARDGEPETLSDRGSAVTWDGRYLPGPWLVTRAMDLAFGRIGEHPVVTVVIRRSHHIACLASYLKRATDRGLLMLLTSSDPSVRTVAPFGGTEPLYTPNPIAAGIPTHGAPVLLDISVSCTANATVRRMHTLGKRLPGPWLLDSRGAVTDEPGVLFEEPAGSKPDGSKAAGSILPLGGTDLGYKGFALGLLVEALTCALGGHGRKDLPARWGASVFLQIIDPRAFGGLEPFLEETSWLADACLNNPPREGGTPVRLPGTRALELRSAQLARGVRLHPTIVPALEPWAEKLGVPLPKPEARDA